MSAFGVAPGQCLVWACPLPQALERRQRAGQDGALPLCEFHRSAFQASPQYLSWRHGVMRESLGAASVALVDWVERLGGTGEGHH